MLKEQTDLYTSIILISLVFLIIVIGLVILVTTYYRKKRIHLDEKKLLHQKFEAELLKSQIEVQEQTMQTIASNLHDNIGQLLSLTNLTLASINIDDQEKASKKINNSTELVNKSIKELRELAKLLQGEKLLEKGIGYALAQEVAWLEKSEIYQINFTNQLEENLEDSAEKDLIILRLFQEIVNNIIKHAQATEIIISLAQQQGSLVIVIKENGIGFNYHDVSKNSSGGLGLHTIDKRVKLIEGTFQVDSEIGKGTQITLIIPYP
ncbi:sensor histidine kinase [Pedobacter sp. ASV28]|uniref:sensor histidine kinase n=1 Tax=Pedobacter sp. ASV28 TaxID=2795123 RepID=UPI0018EC4831|nr:ATP-binding protein [Pedobacter sp. ASV28]